MKIIFVSNYINHHQIPFCKAMCACEGVEFRFVQTEPMEEERVRMGWQPVTELSFLKLYYEEPETCQKQIDDADIVLFGGCEEEGYVAERLRTGKPVFRYSERLYREAQWKAVSPRGLLKKYKDHTRYRRAPVYLLCAGAYVPDDFHIIRAYPGKMYRWGYFPEKKEYDLEKLFAGKGWRDTGAGEGSEPVPYLLWAGRWLDLKHPQMAVEAAYFLKKKGILFHLELAGGGEAAQEERIRERIRTLDLTQEISLPGFLKPDQVREKMERADIYMVTSDRREGWGAVVNEAMNSGCAVVADHMIGAAPYLIRHGENGMIYRDGDRKGFEEIVGELAVDRVLCRRLGEKAYRTIAEVWNAENAAKSLVKLIKELGLWEGETAREIPGEGEEPETAETSEAAEHSEAVDPPGAAEPSEALRLSEPSQDLPPGPGTPAPVIPERKMYEYLMKSGRESH